MELTQPEHKRMYRLLNKGWIDVDSLAEQMFLTKAQISRKITILRSKRINVESRIHPRKPGCKEFRIGDEIDYYLPQSPRSTKAAYNLLFAEMNRIRLEAIRTKTKSIEKMASLALEACGLSTAPTLE